MKRCIFPFLAAVALTCSVVRAASLEAPALTIHDAAEKKTSATVRTGGEIKIVLPAKAESGYMWQIIASDPRVLKPKGEVKLDPAAKAADGSVPWTITLVAQRPGRSVLQFVLVPATAKGEVIAVDSREVTVRVQ